MATTNFQNSFFGAVTLFFLLSNTILVVSPATFSNVSYDLTNFDSPVMALDKI